MTIIVDNYYDAQSLIKILTENGYNNIVLETKPDYLHGKTYIITFGE